MEDHIKNINPTALTDITSLQEVVVVLLNLVEEQSHDIDGLKKTIQELKDEINRLKKEQGIPIFPKPKKDKSTEEEDKSTEEEDKSTEKDTSEKKSPIRKKGNKGPKKDKIVIDHTELCKVSKPDLPSDAVFKYFDEIIQQDVEFVRKNTLYKVEVYYSPSLHKTFRGTMPSDYVGQFGLGIQSTAQLLHQFCDTTQGRLEALFKSLGVHISSGTISNILIRNSEWVVSEQREILRSGIQESPFTQIDSTKSVERGVRKATQIICGDYFSVFYTMDTKSRLSVLEALLGKPSEGLSVAYNETSQSLLAHFGVSMGDRLTLDRLFHNGQVLSLTDLEANIQKAAPSIYCKKNMFARIKESMALGYYHTQLDFPIVDWLLSDDAGEYKMIAREQQGLCWLHDGRHYKKLVPKIEVHRVIWEQIQDEYWDFYQQLLDFKKLTPVAQIAQKQVIEEEFERIFSQTTAYFQVNTCLERTYKNKAKLLAVLDNPALPLHNNAAELGARRVVRKRDISLHTWSALGTQVRDAYMSLVQTAAKLDVPALDYIKDRISRRYEMPSLASLINLAYA